MRTKGSLYPNPALLTSVSMRPTFLASSYSSRAAPAAVRSLVIETTCASGEVCRIREAASSKRVRSRPVRITFCRNAAQATVSHGQKQRGNEWRHLELGQLNGDVQANAAVRARDERPRRAVNGVRLHDGQLEPQTDDGGSGEDERRPAEGRHAHAPKEAAHATGRNRGTT